LKKITSRSIHVSIEAAVATLVLSTATPAAGVAA
jgi:hypothetical protein